MQPKCKERHNCYYDNPNQNYNCYYDNPNHNYNFYYDNPNHRVNAKSEGIQNTPVIKQLGELVRKIQRIIKFNSNKESNSEAVGLKIVVMFLYWQNGILLLRRLLNELAAFKMIGPNLIMMMLMMKKLQEFAFILIAILAMFSITYSMFPTEGDEMPFFKPFFLIGQMIYEYDELLQAKQECYSSRKTGNMTGECSTFAVKAGVSILFVYIVNLMLINFIIALFSRVYERFSEKIEKLWRLNFYRLLQRNVVKPILPSPFCIAEVIFYVGRWMYGKLKCKKVTDNQIKERQEKKNIVSL